MRTSHRLLIVVLVGASLAACNTSTPAPATSDANAPAHVEEIEGSDIHVITLTPRAAERLGIQTAPVTEADGKLVVPYGSVYWDADGAAWAYVQQDEPLTYQREALTVDTIDGDEAMLTAGPPAGAEVVSVGTIELIGTEFKVGH